MIIGIGTDIVETIKIKKCILKWQEKFLNRVFTIQEIEYCKNHKNQIEHFAARFAAKEAFIKAISFQTKKTRLKNIEVIKKNNQPHLKVPKKFTKFNKIFLSLSHSKNYAIAMVIIEEII